MSLPFGRVEAAPTFVGRRIHAIDARGFGSLCQLVNLDAWADYLIDDWSSDMGSFPHLNLDFRKFHPPSASSSSIRGCIEEVLDCTIH